MSDEERFIEELYQDMLATKDSEALLNNAIRQHGICWVLERMLEAEELLAQIHTTEINHYLRQQTREMITMVEEMTESPATPEQATEYLMKLAHAYTSSNGDLFGAFALYIFRRTLDNLVKDYGQCAAETILLAVAERCGKFSRRDSW